MDGILSQLARDQLAAHPMPMNYSQINVGAIGSDKPVDAWHLDSVGSSCNVALMDLWASLRYNATFTTFIVTTVTTFITTPSQTTSW